MISLGRDDQYPNQCDVSMQQKAPRQHHHFPENPICSSSHTAYASGTPKGTVKHPATLPTQQPMDTYDGHLVFSGAKPQPRSVNNYPSQKHSPLISSSLTVSASAPPLLVRDIVCPRCTEMFDSYVQRCNVIVVKQDGEEQYDAKEGALGLRKDGNISGYPPVDVPMNKIVIQSVGEDEDGQSFTPSSTHRKNKGTVTSPDNHMSLGSNNMKRCTDHNDNRMMDVVGEKSPSVAINPTTTTSTTTTLTSSNLTISMSELYARQQHHESLISALSTTVAKQGKQLDVIQELLMSLQNNRQLGDTEAAHHSVKPVKYQYSIQEKQEHHSQPRISQSASGTPNLDNGSYTSATTQLIGEKVLSYEQDVSDTHQESRGAHESPKSTHRTNSFRLVTASTSTGLYTAEGPVAPMGISISVTNDSNSPPHNNKNTRYTHVINSSSSTMTDDPRMSTTSPRSPNHYYSETDNNISTVNGRRMVDDSRTSNSVLLGPNSTQSMDNTVTGQRDYHMGRNTDDNMEDNDRVKSAHTHQYALGSPHRDSDQRSRSSNNDSKRHISSNEKTHRYDPQINTHTHQKTISSSTPVTPLHRSDSSNTQQRTQASGPTSSYVDASDFYHQPRPVLARNKSQRIQPLFNKHSLQQQSVTASASYPHTPKYTSTSPPETIPPTETGDSYFLNKGYVLHNGNNSNIREYNNNNSNINRLNVDKNSSTNRMTSSSMLNGTIHGGLSVTSRGELGVNTHRGSNSKSDDFRSQHNDLRDSYQSSNNSQGPRQASLTSQYTRNRPDASLGAMRQEYPIASRGTPTTRRYEQHKPIPVSHRYQGHNLHDTSISSAGGGLDGYISYDSLEYMKSIGLL